MSDMKCPICGEMLQKYGEVDPDTGTCIVLGANCPKCGIGDSDIKLWQEFIRTQELLEIEDAEHSMCHTQMLKTTEKLERTRKALDVAVYLLKIMNDGLPNGNRWKWEIEKALEQITAILENKNENC